MSNLVKLGLAIGLGVVAAVMNLIYLSSQAAPKLYVGVKDNLAAGEPFPELASAYKEIPIPSGAEVPQGALIPYEKRSLLFGLKTARDFTAGDPVFYRDIQQDLPRYETLGPFSLLSVGSTFIGAVETNEYRIGDRGGVITVAPGLEVEGNYDDNTRKLLQIIDAGRQRGTVGKSHLHIVAIEANPSSSSATSLAKQTGVALIEQQKRALIVPLSDVANIPEVLTIGSEISFIVPAYP